MFLSCYLLVSILYFLNYFVGCEIPSLNVRKMDRALIAKKRQDTLEMCRVFTQENAKIEDANVNIVPSYKRNFRVQTKGRVKRQIEKQTDVNPLLTEADKRRVEDIVDQLYDDMQEKGEKVSYRRNIINSTTTKAPVTVEKINRRLFFAPSRLEFPTQSEFPVQSEETKTSTQTPNFHRGRWEHGIIPYFIDSKTYDVQLQQIIMKAFDYVEKATCIRLQRLKDRPTDLKSLQDVGWIYITNPSGIRQCVHSNEKRKINGVQMIVFGYDCMSLGDVVHEVMHVLGFSHEHTRSDRDQHVTILWENIKPGYKKYFEVNKENSGYNLESLPYDYASVMHYPSRAFSRNGQVTILAEPGMKLGQREGLSEIDVQKIGLVYSSECIARNRHYLRMTCPTVVKPKTKPVNIVHLNIGKYFGDRLWPYGVVNYKLRDKMEFSVEEILNIKAVFSHIEKETCIRFRDVAEDTEPSDEDNSSEDKKGNEAEIVILDPLREANATFVRRRFKRQTKPLKVGRRHSDNVLMLTRSSIPGCKCPPPGMNNGTRILEIHDDCFNSVNDLLHLFVHVLGLDHQHNMYDRDDYLYIVWNNLNPELKNELKDKLPPEASLGFPYDYQSVMHYPWLQIKDGITNIMYPTWNDGWAMGHWQGLSSIDVQKLNLLYFSECVSRRNLENK